MKILTVNGWLGRDERWIWPHIEDPEAHFDYLGREMWEGYRMTWYNRLFRYDSSMSFLGLRALVRMHSYEAVVSSHLSFGAPLGFFRAVLGIRNPPHILVTFILHDHMKNRYLPLIRIALSGMDRVVCHSRYEAKHYPEILQADTSKFTFFPYGVDTDLLQVSHNDDQGYILALGQESRDYRTFFEALQGLDYPVVVVASVAAMEGLQVPSSVTLRTWMNIKDFIRIVDGARCVVVPLKPKEYSSGQQAFLSAMALGKPVVVTETAGSVDYIEDGETGFLVPPGNPAILREKIIALMENGKLGRQMGLLSRQRVEDEYSEKILARRIFELVRTNIKGTHG